MRRRQGLRQQAAERARLHAPPSRMRSGRTTFLSRPVVPGRGCGWIALHREQGRSRGIASLSQPPGSYNRMSASHGRGVRDRILSAYVPLSVLRPSGSKILRPTGVRRYLGCTDLSLCVRLQPILWKGSGRRVGQVRFECRRAAFSWACEWHPTDACPGANLATKDP